MIIHRSDFIATEVPLVNQDCELVIVKLHIVGKPTLYIGSFYRHTNSNTNSLLALQDNLASIMTGDRLPNLVLAGYFNLQTRDWKSGGIRTPAQCGIEVNQLCLDICNNIYLNQTVDEPTRLNNTLDVILATNPDLVNNIQVTPGISDHDYVSADVSLTANTNKKKARTVHLFSKANNEETEKEIAAFKDDFIAASNERTVEDNCNHFKNSIAVIVNKHVSTKVLKEKHDLPWMNH